MVATVDDDDPESLAAFKPAMYRSMRTADNDCDGRVDCADSDCDC